MKNNTNYISKQILNEQSTQTQHVWHRIGFQD